MSRQCDQLVVALSDKGSGYDEAEDEAHDSANVDEGSKDHDDDNATSGDRPMRYNIAISFKVSYTSGVIL